MRHLSTLIPTDLTVRTLLLLGICTGVTAWLFVEYPQNVIHSENLQFGGLVLGAFALATLFDLYLRRGYRVSFDDAAVHWRKVGLRRGASNTIVMPFDLITEVFSQRGSIGIEPFEVAVLRAGMHDISDVFLSRLYLREEDVRDLLVVVANRSKAVFEDEVRDFIETV